MQTARKMLNVRSLARTLLQQIHKQGVTADKVWRSLTSSYTVSLANPDELASKILMNEVYGLNEEELRQFLKKSSLSTLPKLIRLLNSCFIPINWLS